MSNQYYDAAEVMVPVVEHGIYTYTLPHGRASMLRSALADYIKIVTCDIMSEPVRQRREDLNMATQAVRILGRLTVSDDTLVLCKSDKDLMFSILSHYGNMFRHDGQDWVPNTHGKHECQWADDQMRTLRATRESF